MIQRPRVRSVSRRFRMTEDPFDVRRVQEAALEDFDYNAISTYNDTQAQYEMAGQVAPYFKRWRRQGPRP